jgi:hypothetical protein
MTRILAVIFGMLLFSSCIQEGDGSNRGATQIQEAPKAKPVPSKATDITGVEGFELGRPIAEIETDESLAMPSPEDEHPSYTYFGESTYHAAGLDIPMTEVIVSNSGEKGKGEIATYALVFLSMDRSPLSQEDLATAKSLAQHIKKQLLQEYDASLIYEDKETDDLFVFEMRDKEGDSVNVKLDEIGLRYRYRDAATIALADRMDFAEADGSTAQVVLTEKDTPYDLGPLTVEIHKYETQPNLGSKTKAGAKFVVVGLTVTNTTKEPLSFFPDEHFRLMDSDDRSFKTDGDAIFEIDSYLNVRELTPDVPEAGVLVYMVPENSSGWLLAVT